MKKGLSDENISEFVHLLRFCSFEYYK